ncbi:hypothetical protein [Duganella sp. BJB1802]|nr:hypothetical protein [Duganella sp. BJB1802]
MTTQQIATLSSAQVRR